MSDSWGSEEGVELAKEELLILHKSYLKEMLFYLDLHYRSRFYYSIFLSAIVLAFTIVMLQFYTEMLSKILTVIPISVILVAELARRSTDNAYFNYSRSRVKVVKTEDLLGLNEPVKAKDRKPPLKLLFDKDKQFLLNIDLKNLSKYEASQELVKHLMRKGDGRYARILFLAFELIGFILLWASILFFF